ncbi:MAG: addiction module protein [Thiobacillus sp.]|nr:addiction module protein [Thiobacillus sp.]
MDIDLLEEAKKRPFAEKLQLVEDLWDAIAAEAAQKRLSDAQRQLLEARLRESDANPNDGKPWDEVRAEIERSL